MKTDAKLTRGVESYMLGEGADLVGFATIDRFERAPQGHRPQDYLPDAASVISLAVRLADGVCDIWGHASEPGKTIGPYLFYGGGLLLSLELGRLANRVAKMLENMGYKAVMFPPAGEPSVYRWRATRQGESLGDFSHKHAAVAAGLGEFGWSNLVITAKFGPRVRLNSVITNAPLAPSPMYQGQPLCQPERCGYLCVRDCPAKALSPNESRTATIGGKDFTYARIDRLRHAYGISGLVQGSGSMRWVEMPPGPLDYKQLREAQQGQGALDKVLLDGTTGFCGLCQHHCPAPFYKGL